MTDSEKTLFYPVWVSNSGRRSLLWGKPCDSPGEARDICRGHIEAGVATLGFVVRFQGGKRDVLHTYTQPAAAKKVVLHLLALEGALDRGEQGEA